MNEYLSSSKVRTAKLVSALLIAAFLEVGPASSAGPGDSVGGLGGAVGGAVGGLGGAVGGAVGGVGNSVGGAAGGAANSAGNAVGSASRSVGNTVGGVANAVGNTVNGVTGTIGNTVNGVTGTANSPRTIVAQLTNRELVLYKKRCANILRSPQNYDSDMVSICKLIKRKQF
jgi:hypothetical protein